ncbi:MAG: nucleotidyltransferase family protein, partial [Deltaproteobacteria bacterium]|nr:nucleotidyltransferase family protein [Deltaproteobacteria bacterium]
MKAMILAAGLGTRLLPFTQTTPKPLFPIAGRCVLETIIDALQKAGCESIIVNTHHLAHKIQAFISENEFTIPVYTRYEPEILGTAGAIRNVERFWDHRPFFVVNSDIVTDIDFGAVYRFHLSHPDPVTMVLYDYAEINTVAVNGCGFVVGFDTSAAGDSTVKRTFTGIQVLDPKVLGLIPRGRYSSSIDLYRKLILKGDKIRAFLPKNCTWMDIGTPERYRDAVFYRMAPMAFEKAFNDCGEKEIQRQVIQGDGSYRTWYRLTSGKHAMVLSDHGIR